MQRLSEIKEHRYYETIKNSVEHRHDRRTAIFVSTATAVMLALIFIAFNHLQQARSIMAIVMVLFILLPYSLYCTYRAAIPFFYMDSYSFTETMLDHPHSAGRNGMYFTVKLRDRWGFEFEAETHTIFGNAFEPIFEDYINQKALIAYNEKTETVLVIKRILNTTDG